MDYKELVDAYYKLDEQHTQERKTLERKQKLETDELLAKQYEAKKEISFKNFFRVGSTLAIETIEYFPNVHTTYVYNIVAVGDDYLVGFNTKLLENTLITWEDLLEAERVYKNGEELCR